MAILLTGTLQIGSSFAKVRSYFLAFQLHAFLIELSIAKGPQMDWARFSEEYHTLAVLSVVDRDEALARMANQEKQLSDLLRGQLEREYTTEFMATSAPSVLSDFPDLLESGARIGAWRIENMLGAGGMGAVYRVTRDDGTFEQTAALKTLRRTGEGLSMRFENERRRLAMLEHPNIARIIDGGSDENSQPYMVVELVEGEPIDEWASGKTQTEILRLLRQLCAALAHAHARLVLHRDIKPGNVFVNEAGDVRLIDFGIAELADEGAVAGPGPLTFIVAAPEQLEGGQITTATDIFQVGMLAHRLLAGTWPARQPDGGVTIDEGAIRDPDSRAILARATAADPASRYDSIDALGEDFANFAEGSPVMAREGGAIYRVRKFVGRYKVASGLAAVSAVSLIAGMGASLWLAKEANLAREEAELNLEQAEWMANVLDEQTAWATIRNDILERAFGRPENQDVIQAYMLEYWEESKGSVDEDPEYVAQIANVVGSYFMFRNDYTRALEILRFADERKIGRQRTIWQREGLFGRIYLTIGPQDRAEHYVRLAASHMEGTLGENSADHGATTLQLARITLDPEDIRRAIAVVEQVFENGNFKDGPPGYFEGQRAMMHRFLGEYEASRQWYERAFKAHRTNLKATLTSSDTMTLNYLNHLLFVSRDKTKAKSYLDRLAEIDRQKGPSNTRGEYLQMQAILLLSAGKADEALKKIDQAERLFVDYSGADSIDYWALRPLKAKALLRVGRIADAQSAATALSGAPAMIEESREISLDRKLLAQEMLPETDRRLSAFTAEDRQMVCMHLQGLAWFEEMFGSTGLDSLPCAEAIASERRRIT